MVNMPGKVKRLAAVFFSVLTMNLILAACVIQKSSPTLTPGDLTVNPDKSIRIGLDSSLPPFEATDPYSNDVVGFDIELIKSVAEKTGLKLEFVNNPYSQLIAMVSKCQLDAAISAIAISDSLKQQLYFSDVYYTSSNVLVVKKGNITITGLDTLSGVNVGTLAGSPSESDIRKIPGIQLNTYPSFGLAFFDMISGYTQAVIADKLHALTYVEIKPNNLRIIGDEFGVVNYGIAICKKRGDLVEIFNNALAELKIDGTLKKLTEKWLTQVGQ